MIIINRIYSNKYIYIHTPYIHNSSGRKPSNLFIGDLLKKSSHVRPFTTSLQWFIVVEHLKILSKNNHSNWDTPRLK